MSRSGYLELLQEETARGGFERQTVYRDVPFEVVDIVTREVGVE